MAGRKVGQVPDGNQVLVEGGDTRVAFDAPLVAQRIGPAFETVDLVFSATYTRTTWVERRSVALHLDALVGEGRVREEAGKCGLT